MQPVSLCMVLQTKATEVVPPRWTCACFVAIGISSTLGNDRKKAARYIRSTQRTCICALGILPTINKISDTFCTTHKPTLNSQVSRTLTRQVNVKSAEKASIYNEQPASHSFTFRSKSWNLRGGAPVSSPFCTTHGSTQNQSRMRCSQLRSRTT